MAKLPNDQTEGTYLLPRHASEGQRLDDQHAYVVKIMGSSLLHPDITASIPQPQCVVDFGCGTGIWLTEFATEFPSCRCVGLDISSEQFPPKSDLDKRFGEGRVTFATMDMANSNGPPLEFIGQCDVVAVRLVTIGLNGNAWVQAVHNLTQMLKPGGWLQWIESDPLEDVKLHMNDDCPGSRPLNQAFRGQLAGCDTSGSKRLPELMFSAGLVDTRSERWPCPPEGRSLVHSIVLPAMRGVVEKSLVERGDRNWSRERLETVYAQATMEAQRGSCIAEAAFCCYIGRKKSGASMTASAC